MPWPVHPNGLLGAQGDNDAYKVERSLRFNTADSAYLTRNQDTPTSSGTFTLSFWLKRSSFTTDQVIFYGGSVRGAGQPGSDLYVLAAGNLFIDNSTGSGNYTSWQSTGLLRDPSAWYHIVFNQTGSTVNVYVNGTLFWNTTTTASNYFNSGVLHYIGTGAISNPITNFLSAYLTEMHFVDGQVLTPSSFGQTDAITGRWKAKAYSGTYGNNGFYLKFADNSSTAALGTDSSGNSNDWTPNNFSVTAYAANDSLVDSPTNYGTDTGVGGEVRGNYATLNPISTIKGTIIDGALRTNAGDRGSISTIGMTSGKWFCEMYVTALGAESSVGISRGINIMISYVGSSSDSYGYYFNGLKYNNSSAASYGSSYTTGDTIGAAFDADAGTIVFYKNGTSQGTAYTSLTSGPYYFATSGRSSTSANDVTMNFGQQAWKYAPPTGFKALCTTNLPQPTIQKPSKYMDVVAYTGTGASNSISSFGFSPDLVWIKNRGGATSHAIYDTTRGTQAQLSSDTTGDAVTSSSGLTAFDTNGFTIGTSSLVNTSGTQYVAWSWDEAPIAGMDIVSYTGNGANRTIAHGLGVVPKMIVVKARTTAGADQGWPIYHSSLANTQYILLNSTAAAATGADYWNSTTPTSSVFSVGTNVAVNALNDTYISYLFAEVEGFSKFGSYTGNGSADGPFVYCGFRPRFVMIKAAGIGGAGYSWYINDSSRDTFNVNQTALGADLSNSDITSVAHDTLSNGFKIRNSALSWNASPYTFIFAAFAESPFKYARAR